MRWTRPYRPGVVWHVVWWLDVVLAVPLFLFGLFSFAVGTVSTDGAVMRIGAFMSGFAAVVGIGAWRMIRLGVWISECGIEIRSLVRPAKTFSWSETERFEVCTGDRSLLPFVRPAPQVALKRRSGEVVLAPGLWRRSPLTWGGAGPEAIVNALNSARPSAMA